MDADINGEKGALEIPRQQRSVNDPMGIVNGNGSTGTLHTISSDGSGNKKAPHAAETNGSTKKRPATEALEDDCPPAKRGRVIHKGGSRVDADLIVLDDVADGAIVIEDD